MAVISTTQVTVTTAGTRVPISATTLFVKRFVVKALAANTGKMYLGDVTVSASVGLQLSAGESTSNLPAVIVDGRDDFVDLSAVYLDASVSGEKVAVLYVK